MPSLNCWYPSEKNFTVDNRTWGKTRWSRELQTGKNLSNSWLISPTHSWNGYSRILIRTSVVYCLTGRRFVVHFRTNFFLCSVDNLLNFWSKIKLRIRRAILYSFFTLRHGTSAILLSGGIKTWGTLKTLLTHQTPRGEGGWGHSPKDPDVQHVALIYHFWQKGTPLVTNGISFLS